MSVKLGDIPMEDIPIGGVMVARAYLGEVLVFDKAAPYLEISPTVAWIYEDLETQNEVFSNITWNIN